MSESLTASVHVRVCDILHAPIFKSSIYYAWLNFMTPYLFDNI